MIKRELIIYGLRDPRTQAIRYVGKSVFGVVRARQHGMPCEMKKRPSHKTNWIKLLHRLGLNYEIVVLERIDKEEMLYEAEQKWIALGRAAGTLTNNADGGPGNQGAKFSAESRARMSAVRIGKKFTKEHRAKLSLAARSRTPEHRKKIADALRGRTLPPEVVAKIAAAGCGRKPSSEALAKRSASMKKIRAERNWTLGMCHSAETRAKMSDSAKRSRSVAHRKAIAKSNRLRWKTDAGKAVLKKRFEERSKE